MWSVKIAARLKQAMIFSSVQIYFHNNILQQNSAKINSY